MEISLHQVYSFSQMGRRDNQEDARFPDSDAPQAGHHCFVVTDGVGGEVGGEVASNLVASTLGDAINRMLEKGEALSDEMLAEALGHAYEALDKKATGKFREMATTLTLAAFHAEGVVLAHIGDSRIYMVRPGTGIVYRSDDHSLVNQMIHSGIITPEQGINHPQSNIITRCMERVETDRRRSAATVMRTAFVREGDYILLCTDGVVHCISDDALVELLESDAPDQDKMCTLAATCRTSSDNNTATLLHVAAVKDSPGAPQDDAVAQEDNDTVPLGGSDRVLYELEAAPSSAHSSKGFTSFFKKMFS